MKRERIGIFGGTFDPPHLGHLILAEEIREDFGLEEVYFMPCNEPPHKDRPDLTPAKHRFAMVVAATLHNPAFVASPIEVNRPGKSYSIDTLRSLDEQLGEESETLFIAGLDSFLEIETWKEYEAILDACHMIVVSRPGHRVDEVEERLPEWIVERVIDLRGGEDPQQYLGVGRTAAAGGMPSVPGRGSGAAAGELEDAGAPTERATGELEGAGATDLSSGASEGPSGASQVPWRIFLSAAVHVDISSTEVRERVRTGRSIRYRVPAEVERYIEANGLYRNVLAVKEAAS